MKINKKIILVGLMLFASIIQIDAMDFDSFDKATERQQIYDFNKKIEASIQKAKDNNTHTKEIIASKPYWLIKRLTISEKDGDDIIITYPKTIPHYSRIFTLGLFGIGYFYRNELFALKDSTLLMLQSEFSKVANFVKNYWSK